MKVYIIHRPIRIGPPPCKTWMVWYSSTARHGLPYSVPDATST